MLSLCIVCNVMLRMSPSFLTLYLPLCACQVACIRVPRAAHCPFDNKDLFPLIVAVSTELAKLMCQNLLTAYICIPASRPSCECQYQVSCMDYKCEAQ